MPCVEYLVSPWMKPNPDIVRKSYGHGATAWDPSRNSKPASMRMPAKTPEFSLLDVKKGMASSRPSLFWLRFLQHSQSGDSETKRVWRGVSRAGGRGRDGCLAADSPVRLRWFRHPVKAWCFPGDCLHNKPDHLFFKNRGRARLRSVRPDRKHPGPGPFLAGVGVPFTHGQKAAF